MEDESIRLFAPVIWAYVESLRKVTDKQVRTNLEGGLSTTLQKWTDQPAKIVSKKVLENCQANNPTIDPFKLLWDQRDTLGKIEVNIKSKKGKTRLVSRLVWEHTTPLSEFSDVLIKCKTIEDITKALINYSGVCWISREEDNLLNKKGYKNSRPGGWKKCYKECGIEVRGHQ
jgi:hypothetical protein